MVPKICSIDSCTTESTKRGWCNKHYKRWYKYGDPMFAHFERFTDRRAALMSKTAQAGDCIEWIGLRNENGYGRMWDGQSVQLAHRVAWTLNVGPIPLESVIDHACHNPACVRIEHLRLVTQAENMQNRKGPQANNALGVRGVHFDSDRGKYVAQVQHQSKNIPLGRFLTLEEASEAVHQKRLELGFLGEIVTLDQPRHWEDFDPTMLRDIGPDCGA